MFTFATREATLVNGSFFLLFLQTVLRWADPRLFEKQKKGLLVPIFTILGRSSALFLRSALVVRWVSSQHFPVSNLYESLIFLSFLLTIGITRMEKTGAPKAALALAFLCPVLLIAFASFCLPEELRVAGPLVPALKSNWLLMHVTVMILAYAGLLLGSLLSLLFLATNSILNKPETEVWLTRLDQSSYRLISFGFPFLTLGILSGAVWANETWGSYWSWDPKETWSLITWLVFAAYLHTRLIRGLQGFVPASLASRGFVLVWICYLGVNLLGKGLHSYGWFSTSSFLFSF